MTTTIPRWLRWLVAVDPRPERATPPQPIRLPRRPVYPIVRDGLTPSDVLGLALGGPHKADSSGPSAPCRDADCPTHGDTAPDHRREKP